jgi:Pentapeptide repeats (8 copies)
VAGSNLRPMNPTVLAAVIGVSGTVIVAVVGFWASVRNTSKSTALTLRAVELTKHGQVNDMYSKAVEQLGSDKLDVRLGGIYALERVAHDSPRDHPTVMEVLGAFVREHSREPWRQAEREAEEPYYMTRPDVQAAVTVIGRRDSRHDRNRVDLGGADLSGADLGRLNLAGADFFEATLIQTIFTHANLTGANLTSADLTDAAFFGANLSKAVLENANLAKALFSGKGIAILANADLTLADLRDANISGVDFTGVNLTGALVDETQPVPDGWLRDPSSGRLKSA